MNEILINLSQQNRAENLGEKRGKEKKIPSGTIVNEEIPQKEQQLGPSRQYNNLPNDESSDGEEDDATTCKIDKIPSIELTEKCEDICDISHQYISSRC